MKVPTTFHDVTQSTILRSARTVAMAAMLALSAGAAYTHSVSAAVGLCRTDPHVMLSNGAQIDMKVAIGDFSADVQSVTYTVHVPSGTTVDKIVYTGNGLRNVENVVVIPDNPTGVYDTDTLVITGTPAAVSASTKIPSVDSGSTSGSSGQDLFVHIAG